ncbi:MAG: hypothetical protein M0Q21_03345 [Ignavibacteriaceae bacterium]|nr:hypothetical protein [Ignavibacteriaceae bacterium]
MLFKHHLLSIALLSFVLYSTFSFAQKCKILELSKISVDILYNDSEISPSQSLLFKSMEKALEEKNLLAPHGEKILDYIFLVTAKEYQRNSKKEILASIIAFAKIPDEVVEIGAKEEALYKVIGDTAKFNIPEIGREVRKLMSADYMRRFGEVSFQLLEIVPSDKTDMFCQSAVTKFLGTNKKK